MKSATMSVAALLESFFHQRLIAQRRVSHQTVLAYRDALRLFLVFAAERAHTTPEELTLKQLDCDVVLAFLDHLELERRNSIRTRNARRAALRAFFQYVGYLDPAALAIVRRILAIPAKLDAKPLLGYVVREELTAILATPDRSTRHGQMEYAFLLFLSYTGARVSEAIGVTATDLHLTGAPRVALHGKGGAVREVPLSTDLARVLRDLCEEWNIGMHETRAVFRNRRGQPFTRFGITHLIRRVLLIASQTAPSLVDKRVSPHTFRHTTGMCLLQSGVDLNIIRSWLGHLSLDTTHQYVEADQEMKRKALEQSGLTTAESSHYKPSDAVLAILESFK
ncbi:MAG: tyrosine-type recombinase/integrase [Armatimonadota bacterium]